MADNDLDDIFFQAVIAALSVAFMLIICFLKSKSEARLVKRRESSHVTKPRMLKQRDNIFIKEVLTKLVQLQKQTMSPPYFDADVTANSPPDLKCELKPLTENVNSTTLIRNISEEEPKDEQHPFQLEICRESRSDSTLKSIKYEENKTNIEQFLEKQMYRNCLFTVHSRNSGKPKNSIRTINNRKFCEISVKRDTNRPFILFSKIAVKYQNRVSLLKLSFGHVVKRKNSRPMELLEKSFHSHQPAPRCIDPTMDIVFLQQLIETRYLPTRLFKPVLPTVYEDVEGEENCETT